MDSTRFFNINNNCKKKLVALFLSKLSFGLDVIHIEQIKTDWVMDVKASVMSDCEVTLTGRLWRTLYHIGKKTNKRNIKKKEERGANLL